ncbi:MAG: SPOR domain-containing protein [Treponema sp.]|jgi:DedD protein|nr:SPOR domain-containing protein [Treponema sp.]
MEKKKILLIAIITGVFLTAVILFPLVLLSNSKATASETTAPPEIYNAPPASADVMEMVTTPSPQRDTQNITINNYSPDPTTVESAKNPDGSVTINVLPASPGQSTTITQTPALETSPQSTSVAEKPANSPNPPILETQSQPTPAKKPSAQTPAPASTVAKATTPVKTTPPKPAVKAPPKQQEASEYWIQTGSFSVKANAEKAKALLDEKGIPKVVVEDSIVKERIVFRLRSGPHRTKEEVEFWLNLVKALDGFKESYILER